MRFWVVMVARWNAAHDVSYESHIIGVESMPRSVINICIVYNNGIPWGA